MRDKRKFLSYLEEKIKHHTEALLSECRPDGHWIFPLEAPVITAEYIIFRHFLGDIDEVKQEKMCRYMLSQQNREGGWSLYYDGDSELSTTVKFYLALRLAGIDANTDYMIKARELILRKGGAESSNVFTRVMLCLYGFLPWRLVPIMPVEIIFLPRFFPFHLSKISYWSRTVLVPLLIIKALKPLAANKGRINIDELFVKDPKTIRRFIYRNETHKMWGKMWGKIFITIDRFLRLLERFFPKRLRNRAISKALDWCIERRNGVDGLGAIFPAMANFVMALHALGFDKKDKVYKEALIAIDNLICPKGEKGLMCQPCVSPVWDTGLSLCALLEADNGAIKKSSLDWLESRQIKDTVGDWHVSCSGIKSGGWAFQYNNSYYPDTDDTAVIGFVLSRLGGSAEVISRAKEWVISMQSKNGGWASFDVDNMYHYLNNIPFSDHGALLDPPSVDVTSRCVSFLVQCGLTRDDDCIKKALNYLRSQQEKDGSWFGRWGCNYIYGTWSALSAFNAVSEDIGSVHIRRGVDFLLSRQRPDGGWGEDGASYWADRKTEVKSSTPSQTSWALLGLMAARQVNNEAVDKGIEYLLRQEYEIASRMREDYYNAVGFPRVFYLHYHGYSSYFPLWALSRYRNLKKGNSFVVDTAL